MNLTHSATLARRNRTGVWYRASPPAHLAHAISTAHTRNVASRFSAGSGSFEVLYLAEDPLTCLYEVGAIYGSPASPIPNPATAWVHLPVRVDLTDIADLTEPAQAHILGTNAQELTGDWQGFALRSTPTPGSPSPHTGRPPTHLLGDELYHHGFKGLLSFSAAHPPQKILAIFPERIAAPCFVEYEYEYVPGHRRTVRIP